MFERVEETSDRVSSPFASSTSAMAKCPEAEPPTLRVVQPSKHSISLPFLAAQP